MASADLEKRVKALEDEVAKLKVKLESSGSEGTPWWKQISGIFADDPAFEEAMRLGTRVARIIPAKATPERRSRTWSFWTPII